MKRIYLPTAGPSDWKAFLAKPEKHWKPGYSAMATAASWEAAHPGLPPEVSAGIAGTRDPALQNVNLLAAFPEWPVPLPGVSRPSWTDVMVITGSEAGVAALGVEGKCLEDFGPTLGEKRAEASSGQGRRIDFLHQELRLDLPLGDHIRYQLLHRTVSAIITARWFHAATAAMVVHQFGDASEVRADFDRFAEAMGGEQKAPGVFSVARFAHPRLHLLWCDGDEAFLDVDLRKVGGLTP